ncbi:MAG: hypothetical protein H6R10_1610 [Rhodocyclaceae bacterium]|nr:hypothetical protein [Rhodocyclaceae bacterium]
MHLFTDISSHGFGHLAITAPVLNALAEMLPGLRLTVRSRVPAAKLRERIQAPFELVDGATDFGYVMVDALAIDREATALAYRRAHADWERAVEAEAVFLQGLAPQYVLTNVSYLPLAGAARVGIPAASLCSLNWADLFAHFFGAEPWAAPIHSQMLAAYRSARAFLRATPGMPMADLERIVPVAPIARLGRRHDLGLGEGVRAVLLSMGGIDHRLPVEDWPCDPGLRWLVPESWGVRHPQALAAESFGLSFTDLLCSVDAVVTKPGYGTFTEAACNGTPVLYQRRADWPEQDCLIDWLAEAGRCRQVGPATLAGEGLAEALADLWALPPRPLVPPSGGEEAAAFLARELRVACSRSA